VGVNTSQPESFQIPFLVWGLALWPRPGDPEPLTRPCFLSGVFLSAAVLFKTPAVTIPLVLLVERLLLDRSREGWKGKLGLTGVTLLGLSLLPALLVAYYTIRGAWAPLIDAWVTFPANYANCGAHYSTEGHWAWIGSLIGWLLPGSGLALLLLGFGRGLVLRRGEALHWAALTVAAWAIVAIQSRYFDYHYYPFTPFLAWGMGLAFIPDRTIPAGSSRTRSGLNAVSLVAGGVLLGLTLVAYGTALLPRYAHPGPLSVTDPPDVSAEEALRGGEATSVAQWIRASTQPEDSVFVWGDDPFIYFQSRRPMAGPYGHLLALIPPWGGHERLDALLDRFGRKPPAIIVVSSGNHWFRDRAAVLLLDEFPEMRDFIHERYENVCRIGGYQIWKRTD
jgi:hypothetical protein